MWFPVRWQHLVANATWWRLTGRWRATAFTPLSRCPAHATQPEWRRGLTTGEKEGADNRANWVQIGLVDGSLITPAEARGATNPTARLSSQSNRLLYLPVTESGISDLGPSVISQFQHWGNLKKLLYNWSKNLNSDFLTHRTEIPFSGYKSFSVLIFDDLWMRPLLLCFQYLRRNW